MTTLADFPALLSRVRAGDQHAATQLHHRFAPLVRRTVAGRMMDSRLRRAFDAEDVCQEVMARFFRRAAEYTLATEDDAERLLTTMARRKLSDRIDAERAECRDNRRAAGEADYADVVSTAPSAVRVVIARDLWTAMRSRLSPEDRELADWRATGAEWDEIAQHVGGTAEALRKRLARAADRIAEELGLDS